MSFILMAALLDRGDDLRAGVGHRGRHGRGGVGMSMRPENPAIISDLVGGPVGDDTPPPKTPSSKRWTRFILPTYTALFILYLIIPIVVMIVFAFNTPVGRYNIKWEHASLEAWRNLFSVPRPVLVASADPRGRAPAPRSSPRSSGTFIGLALGRYRFRGVGRHELRDLPGDRLSGDRPGVVDAHDVRERPACRRGSSRILLAHTMFCVSFVAITVRARVSGHGQVARGSCR